jgi:RNA polymerase sigma-70 factor (ECF subfamily)
VGDPSRLSAAELIVACSQSRDEALWREFLRRFGPVISSTAARLARKYSCYSTDLVEELTQEAYAKISTRAAVLLHDFEPRSEDAPYAFVKVVAANAIRDYFRLRQADKRGESETVQADNAEILPRTDDPAEATEHRILLDQIEKLLQDQWPSARRDRDVVIFRLYYRQGYTAQLIASIPHLSLTVKAVETTLARMTYFLRGFFESGSDGQSPIAKGNRSRFRF